MSYVKTSAAGSFIAVLINATYVTIPGVEGIPEFGPEKGEYENTAINDTSKTFGDDLPDNGSLDLTGSWDSRDVSHAYLLTRGNTASTTDSFKVTWHSGATDAFTAKVMKFRRMGAKGSDEKFAMRLRAISSVTHVAAT
jgi:hypothetical protein